MKAMMGGADLDDGDDINFPMLRNKKAAIVPVKPKRIGLDKTNVVNKVEYGGFFKKKRIVSIEVLDDHLSGDKYTYDESFIEAENVSIDDTDDELFASAETYVPDTSDEEPEVSMDDIFTQMEEEKAAPPQTPPPVEVYSPKPPEIYNPKEEAPPEDNTEEWEALFNVEDVMKPKKKFSFFGFGGKDAR